MRPSLLPNNAHKRPSMRRAQYLPLLNINNHNQSERIIMKTRENLEHQEQDITISSHDERGKSRRMFLGMAALAGTGLFGIGALAQTRTEQLAGRTGNSASDPGPENKSLLDENPNSNRPPFTDHGNPGPIWHSFDLAPKWIQAGRVDAPGNPAGAAFFKRHSRCQHAPHCWLLSRAALTLRR